MLKTLITDPLDKIQAAVVGGDEENALVVATRPLKTYINALRFFVNDDYGADMNQNSAAGGTPEKVHNGIDDVLWTGTSIIDDTDFDSDNRAHTGLASISFESWSNTGDLCQIAKGSNLDLSDYVSLTMWVNINNNWGDSDSVSVYGWDTATGLIVGVQVFLENYMDYSVYDVWHKLTIPLSDMGLTGATIDSIRFRYANSFATDANFFIDDIQFEETGTPIKFCLKPDKGTWLHVNSFQILLADAYAGTVSDGTMPGIPYNSLLGVAKLTTGITYRRVTNGVILSSANIQQFLDFMAFSNAQITGSGSDGTNTWVTVNMQFTEPVILKAEDEDEMSLTVNDDLSGLLVLRVGAGSKIETRG